MKQLLLATFYGFRQVLLQLLVLLVFESTLNDADFCAECLLGFTMLYHWFAVFIPKNKQFLRFVIPYISWIGTMFLFIGFHRCYWLMFFLLPFVCQMFFIMEDYLKKILATYQKLYKWAKIIGVSIGAIASFIFVPILWSEVTDMVTRRCRPSTEHLFDETKELTIETGLDFPEYKVTEYTKNHICYHGYYSDEWTAEFLEMPSKEFYNAIDSLSRVEESNWELIHGQVYQFYREQTSSSDVWHSLRVNLNPDSNKFYIYFEGK